MKSVRWWAESVQFWGVKKPPPSDEGGGLGYSCSFSFFRQSLRLYLRINLFAHDVNLSDSLGFSLRQKSLRDSALDCGFMAAGVVFYRKMPRILAH